jgi:hypothetical protein
MGTVSERTEVSEMLPDLLNLPIRATRLVQGQIASATVALTIHLVQEVSIIPRGLPHQTEVPGVSEDIDKISRIMKIETSSI